MRKLNDWSFRFAPIFDGDSWVFAPIINTPSGGNVIDVEARQALSSLLEHLRSTGCVTR